MRHIDLQAILTQIFSDANGKTAQARLRRAHKKLAIMLPADRAGHIGRNGANKWKPIKDLATGILGTKCWYTEVELIGAPLAIDHYRPIRDYWWLAYDADNYRVSCPWVNSPKDNAEHGWAGGKGDHFPLLPPALRARGRNRLRIEKPLLLDPCKAEDCALLAFQADGRPILNPMFGGDPIAIRRVEESKVLLNLDHPDFNSKREQLCRDIEDTVRAYEALPVESPERTATRNRLRGRLAPAAPYSTAARFYLRLHRHLDWVQNILDSE